MTYVSIDVDLSDYYDEIPDKDIMRIAKNRSLIFDENIIDDNDDDFFEYLLYLKKNYYLRYEQLKEEILKNKNKL
jgi:hypothetical protein